MVKILLLQILPFLRADPIRKFTAAYTIDDRLQILFEELFGGLLFRHQGLDVLL